MIVSTGGANLSTPCQWVFGRARHHGLQFDNIFVFFLPITLTLYLLSGRKLRNIVLLLTSLLFYTWGEGKYVSVLLVCIVANYIFAALMEISYGTANRPVLIWRPKVYWPSA